MEFYNQMWKRKIPQLLFYIGLTMELGMVIIDKSSYVNPIEGKLFRITFLLFAAKAVLTEYTGKERWLIFFIEVIGMISYKVTGKNDVIRIVTFIIACKGIPLKQMFRYTFYVTLIGCAAIVFLSVTGIYGEMRLTAYYGRGINHQAVYEDPSGRGIEETRYTLGMGHPNALACMFLMTLILGIYAFSERLKWYYFLFFMLLNIGVYWLTDSKTSMGITTLLLAGSFMMTCSKFMREKKFAYICVLLLFLLCIGVSVDAAVNAPKVRMARWCDIYLGDPRADELVAKEYGINTHIVAMLRIDEHINGRVQSLTDSERNDGTIETWSAFSCPENMTYYFDMGWVKLFYRYGVIPGILYCIGCLALLWKLYRRRDAFGLVAFAVLALYTVVEAHLFSIYIGRNYLLMMMGCYFFMTQPDAEGELRLLPEGR